ncbi:Hypothetical predicted protein [Mytilus galloprovincialis]|uniref:Cystatin domain-containing protein n=1 Tax=Mytilus galloprovincialis TaxID=29158 RepID=A0A8B6CKM3_MYTGA|nr:Hypothetical predicted protein [Mytilus galloprovincialis]
MKVLIPCLFVIIGIIYVNCQIPGGWNKIDVDTIPDIVIKAAKDKLDSENILFNTTTVVKAEEQVISGWNFKFTVRLDNQKECQFFIFYKWDWTTTIREFHCSN